MIVRRTSRFRADTRNHPAIPIRSATRDPVLSVSAVPVHNKSLLAPHSQFTLASYACNIWG
jgi:hypothetical protein